MDINKKNSFWLALHYITMMIFSFVTLKINLLQFGERAFGIWLTVAALWGVGSVLDFGLGISIIKFIAEENRLKKDLHKLIVTGFYSFVFLGILIFIIVFLVGEFAYFTNKSIIPNEIRANAKWMFLFLGLSFYAKYIGIFLKAIFEGFNNFVLTSKVNILNTLLIFTSVLLTSLFDLSLSWLAFLYFLSSLIVVIILFLKSKIDYSFLSYKIKYYDSFRLKKILSYSFTVQGATILGRLTDPAVKYIIGNFFRLEYVSIFEIARRFSVAITGLFHTSFRNLLPRSSGLVSNEEKQDFVFTELAKISKLGNVYSGLMYGVLLWIPLLLIDLWFNQPAAILIYLILVLPESINAYGYSIYVFFLGIGKAVFATYVQLINLVGYSLFLFLIFYFFNSSLGFFGYYITVISGNVFLFLTLKRIIGIDLKEFLKRSGFSNLLLLNVIIFTTVFLVYFNDNLTWLFISFTSLIALLIYLNDFVKLKNQLISMFKLRNG